MSIELIINTLSGHRSLKRNRRLITQVEQGLGEPIHAHMPNSVDALEEVLTQILNSESTTLLIAGGDGTLNLVINLLLNHPHYRPLNLGVIPNGTGNSFALDLGIHDLSSAIRAIKQQQTVHAVVGKVRNSQQSRYFINNVAVGLVYDIAALASKMRPLGAFSYVLATLIHLLKFSSFSLKGTFQGNPIENRYLFAEFCKSQYTGGAMRMGPNARITDVQMQMILLEPRTRGHLLAAFPKLFKGKHLNYSFVSHSMVDTAHFECDPPQPLLIDGELAFQTPVEVSLTPLRISFFSNETPPKH